MFNIYKGNLDCKHERVAGYIKKEATRLALNCNDRTIKNCYYRSKLRNQWTNPGTALIKHNQFAVHPGMKRLLVVHAYKMKTVPAIMVLTSKSHEIMEKYPFLKKAKPYNKVHFYNMVAATPNVFQISTKEQSYYINQWEDYAYAAYDSFNDVTNHYGNIKIECAGRSILVDGGENKTYTLQTHPDKLWVDLRKLFDKI